MLIVEREELRATLHFGGWVSLDYRMPRRASDFLTHPLAASRAPAALELARLGHWTRVQLAHFPEANQMVVYWVENEHARAGISGACG
jgi:hypothetical protein